MKIYANMHTHSTHSDGVYTPAELVKIAKDEGYGAIAITDHDTATAYPELKAECDKLGMETIFGCEFSVYSEEFKSQFHITAYDFDPEYPEMKEYLRGCSDAKTKGTKLLFERGRENGYIPEAFTWQDVLDYNKGITWLGNDSVFRTMKHKGLAVDTDYPAFFSNVYGKHRSEVPKYFDFLSLTEIIRLIKAAGGICIVAHPAKSFGKLEYVPRLAELGIDGIEVWHWLLTDDEKVEALKLALKYKLYISGGSDHAGLCGGQYQFYEDYKSTCYYVPECSMGTTKEFFDEIVNRKLMPNRDEYIEKYIEEYK